MRPFVVGARHGRRSAEKANTATDARRAEYAQSAEFLFRRRSHTLARCQNPSTCPHRSERLPSHFHAYVLKFRANPGISASTRVLIVTSLFLGVWPESKSLHFTPPRNAAEYQHFSFSFSLHILEMVVDSGGLWSKVERNRGEWGKLLLSTGRRSVCS